MYDFYAIIDVKRLFYMLFHEKFVHYLHSVPKSRHFYENLYQVRLSRVFEPLFLDEPYVGKS